MTGRSWVYQPAPFFSVAGEARLSEVWCGKVRCGKAKQAKQG